MEVKTITTNGFEKNFKKFSSQDQTIIEKKMDFLVDLKRRGESAGQYLQKIRTIGSGDPSDITVYALRVNMDIRIFLTSESNAIENEHAITFLAVVHSKDLDKAVNGISETFYQSAKYGEEG